MADLYLKKMRHVVESLNNEVVSLERVFKS